VRVRFISESDKKMNKKMLYLILLLCAAKMVVASGVEVAISPRISWVGGKRKTVKIEGLSAKDLTHVSRVLGRAPLDGDYKAVTTDLQSRGITIPEIKGRFDLIALRGAVAKALEAQAGSARVAEDMPERTIAYTEAEKELRRAVVDDMSNKDGEVYSAPLGKDSVAVKRKRDARHSALLRPKQSRLAAAELAKETKKSTDLELLLAKEESGAELSAQEQQELAEARQAADRGNFMQNRQTAQEQARRDFAVMMRSAVPAAGGGVVPASKPAGRSARPGRKYEQVLDPKDIAFDESDHNRGVFLGRESDWESWKAGQKPSDRALSEWRGNNTGEQIEDFAEIPPFRELPVGEKETLAKEISAGFKLPAVSAQEETAEVRSDEHVDTAETHAEAAELAERRAHVTATASKKRKEKGGGAYTASRELRRAGDMDPEQFAARDLERARVAELKKKAEIKREESRALRAARQAGGRDREMRGGGHHEPSVRPLVGFTEAGRALQEKEKAESVARAETVKREAARVKLMEPGGEEAKTDLTEVVPTAPSVPKKKTRPSQGKTALMVAAHGAGGSNFARGAAATPPAVATLQSDAQRDESPTVDSAALPLSDVGGKPAAEDTSWSAKTHGLTAAGFLTTAILAMIPEIRNPVQRQMCVSSMRRLLSPKTRAAMTKQEYTAALRGVFATVLGAVGLGFAGMSAYKAYKNRDNGVRAE